MLQIAHIKTPPKPKDVDAVQTFAQNQDFIGGKSG